MARRLHQSVHLRKGAGVGEGERPDAKGVMGGNLNPSVNQLVLDIDLGSEVQNPSR